MADRVAGEGEWAAVAHTEGNGRTDEAHLEEDRLAGHLVVCPHRGWLDLEGHLGDLLECHRGVWLPHLGLVMPLSLASGLNIQLQMVKG